MKKTNSKYRVPGSIPAPTGYPEPEPVKPGTHQVSGPTKFYPELEPDATGSIFWDPDPAGPHRVWVWVPGISAHP